MGKRPPCKPMGNVELAMGNALVLTYAIGFIKNRSPGFDGL
jgi:hypothetical protein